jgi:hypothetical protein
VEEANKPQFSINISTKKENAHEANKIDFRLWRAPGAGPTFFGGISIVVVTRRIMLNERGK